MKINVEYTNEMIKELIKKDIQNKMICSNEVPEIVIKVRSKQNYREKDWELGELQCNLTITIKI